GHWAVQSPDGLERLGDALQPAAVVGRLEDAGSGAWPEALAGRALRRPRRRGGTRRGWYRNAARSKWPTSLGIVFVFSSACVVLEQHLKLMAQLFDLHALRPG